MGSDSILPDTCAWIDYFNGHDTPIARSLAQSLTSREVTTCGVVMYELFQGIRSEKEATLLHQAFSSLRFINFNKDLWITAAQLSSTLRKTGVTIPASDIQIATVALQHNLTILTVDQHFRLIPNLKLE